MAEPAQEAQQYLTFFVSGDEYAVPILKVREIIEHAALTHVPTTPRFIRGVRNLRGQVVPIVDLAVKFGMTETEVGRYTCHVVLEVDRGGGDLIVLGVMADTVDQVIDLHAGDIEPPPEFGVPVHTEFLKGLGRVGQDFVLILDIDRVMASNEISAVAALQAGPEAASEVPPGEDVENPAAL